MKNNLKKDAFMLPPMYNIFIYFHFQFHRNQYFSEPFMLTPIYNIFSLFHFQFHRNQYFFLKLQWSPQ